ncbi:uncharacterized protein MONBRDRAFT_15514, partial [Monosiga brevicollis MX1]
VGYIIITFQSEGERAYSFSGLDGNQRKCLHFALTSTPEFAFEPEYRCQSLFTRITLHTYFEYFIMLTIAANSFVMLMQHKDMDDDYKSALALCNVIFTGIFTFEALIKLFAYNPTAYFQDAWNWFDFIIVVGSLVDVAFYFAGTEAVSIGFLRLFRAARLIKLVSKGNDMKRLLWTFAKSLQALPSVALLIAMVFFVYAVIGMQVFGNMALRPDADVNAQVNFRDFSSALLVLFRTSTGENWQAIMYYCYLGPEDCRE